MRQKRRRQEIRLYKLIIGSVLLGLVFLILFFVTQGIYRGGIINNILGILIVIILNVIMLLCSITSFCGTMVFFVLLLITKIRTKRDEELIKSKILEQGMEDYVIMLGKKENPYPYIKSCDIYVQPSRHEAFGLVVLEAKILQKPIVCTDFDGADEQIDHGKNGMIVPILDVSALVQTVGTLIRCPEQRNNLVRELKKWTPEDDLREIIRHFE